MSPTSKRSPVASRRRASASHSATTSGLRSSPRSSTSRPWTADEEVVEGEGEVRASRPEVDDAQLPARKRGDDVLDELDEAVDLPELRPPLRADAAVRGLHAELHEERHGLALGQQMALRAVVGARCLRTRRRPPKDARLAARRPAPASRRRARGAAPGGIGRRSPREGRRRAPGRRGSRPSSGARSGVARASEPPARSVTGSTVIRLGSSGCADRGLLSVAPRQRRFADEPLDEIVDVAHSGAATTQTSWPLVTATPALTARSRTTPTRGATISFSIFIASTTQSS